MTNLTKLNNLTKMNLSFENWTKLSKLKNQTNKVFQARFKEARLDAPAFKNGKKVQIKLISKFKYVMLGLVLGVLVLTGFHLGQCQQHPAFPFFLPKKGWLKTRIIFAGVVTSTLALKIRVYTVFQLILLS